MAAPRRRVVTPTRLLTALMIASAAIVLLDTAFTTQTPDRAHAPWKLAAFSAMVLGGLLRSRRSRWEKPAVTVFVVAAFVASQLGSGTGVTLGLAFTAVILAVATLPIWVGWTLIGVNAVVVWLTSLTVYDAAPLLAAVDALGSVILLGLAVVVGVLVRDLQVSLDRTGALLGQRDEAVAHLTSANLRLTESIEREKDLVLAEERARAARDLHDGLGQRLTAIKLNLDYALRVRSRDATAAWEEVSVARQGSAAALTEMRTWVRALHPVTVSGLTVDKALEAIAESFRGTGFEVGIHVTGRRRPLTEAETMYIYRLVQEGLTNALRHARATRVELDVAVGDGLTVELRDNGLVSRPEAPEPLTEGFGLRSMRERAEALGGAFGARWGEQGLVVRADLPAPEGAVALVVPVVV